MDILRGSIARKMATGWTITAAAVVCLIGGNQSVAAPIFYSTSDSAHWQVATNLQGTDGLLSSFPTTGFVPATVTPGRQPGTWLANNSTGTNGSVGDWTFFVFRQTFDLTGYNPATADLQFQWAGDDSGQGFAAHGTWVPKYSLNGGAPITGVWPGGDTYSFGPTTEISTGFVAGQNTLDFYVEGNGVTDGFALQTVSFTAQPVPEPESCVLLLASIGSLGVIAFWNMKPCQKVAVVLDQFFVD